MINFSSLDVLADRKLTIEEKFIALKGQVSPTGERWWRVFLTGHVDSFSLSLQCTIL